MADVTTPTYDYTTHLGYAYEIFHGDNEGTSSYWDENPPTDPDAINIYRVTEQDFDHYEAEIAEDLADREEA